MNDPSHRSSSQYKVNYETYTSEWQRIFGTPKQVPQESDKTKEDSDTKV